MRALVTGGTGFIGSHVVRALIDAGHQVRVLHRKTSKLDLLDGVAYESAFGDVLELDALRAACEGCDWVFHVAAVADYWRAEKARVYEVNVQGTERVLQAAREAGVKRVVFTSSASTIGITDGRASDESVPFNLPPHRFPYAHSKVLAEQSAQDAVRAGQDVVIVNPSVVMGPGDLNQISGSMVIEAKQRGRLMPIPPGGAGYVDVRDVARWQIAAAERGISGERYLLNTANYSHREWFDLIAEVVGAPKPVIPVPHFAIPAMAVAIGVVGRRLGLNLPIDPNQVRLSARNIYFNPIKAWTAFGQPQVTMRQSVADTYTWYRERGLVD